MKTGRKNQLKTVGRKFEQGKEMKDSDFQHGIEIMNREQIGLIKTPKESENYIPISYLELANKIIAISKDLLTGFTLMGDNYFVARKGLQLFGILKFHGVDPQIGLAVAFRNSYDKSMAIDLAVGGYIGFCDSIVLPGESRVMKHTKNIRSALENLIVTTLYKGKHNFKQVIEDADRLKEISVSDQEAFKLMGLLYGNDIISPRQLAALKEEWLHSQNLGFQKKNMWTFLAATMLCLKSSPPPIITQKHIAAYEMITSVNNNLKWFNIDPNYQFQFDPRKADVKADK